MRLGETPTDFTGDFKKLVNHGDPKNGIPPIISTERINGGPNLGIGASSSVPEEHVVIAKLNKDGIVDFPSLDEIKNMPTLGHLESTDPRMFDSVRIRTPRIAKIGSAAVSLFRKNTTK